MWPITGVRWTPVRDAEVSLGKKKENKSKVKTKKNNSQFNDKGICQYRKGLDSGRCCKSCIHGTISVYVLHSRASSFILFKMLGFEKLVKWKRIKRSFQDLSSMLKFERYFLPDISGVILFFFILRLQLYPGQASKRRIIM